MGKDRIGRLLAERWVKKDILRNRNLIDRRIAPLNELALDIDAPIEPGIGLGGLSLRTHVRDISHLLFYMTGQLDEHGVLVYPYEVRYTFLGGKIEACVDVRNGKIFKLIAGAGYAGSLWNSIKVGMNMAQALAHEPRLYFDDRWMVVSCPGVPGVVLDIDDDDPLIEEVPNMEIIAICVVIDEFATSAGQHANW